MQASPIAFLDPSFPDPHTSAALLSLGVKAIPGIPKAGRSLWEINSHGVSQLSSRREARTKPNHAGLRA